MGYYAQERNEDRDYDRITPTFPTRAGAWAEVRGYGVNLDGVTVVAEPGTEPTEDEQAAERTRAFLHERQRAHRNGEEIYSLGGPEGMVALRHDDLERLVRAVLPDADLGAEDPRVTRGRQSAARELGKALRSTDLLAAERHFAGGDDTPGEE